MYNDRRAVPSGRAAGVCAAAVVTAMLVLLPAACRQRGAGGLALGETAGIALGGGAVVEVEPPPGGGCGGQCVEGYWKFVERERARTTPVADSMLEARLREAEQAPASRVLELDWREIEERLRRALAIDSLLAGLGERRLTVAVLERAPAPDLVESRLLFSDPEVGSFEALLLEPATRGPHPAIIGLHGHRDSARDFAQDYLGRELARRGFVVLIPELRAFDCSRRENRIAWELLEVGRTLMGLRVYETLLMARYLEHRADVDSGRISLFGHSGGASVANLAVRLARGFAAKVTDYRVDYRDRCGPHEVHCETLPALMPLSAEIGHDSALEIPVLQVTYKFEDPASRAAILAFFEAALGG
jgi:hypothetical protein